MMIGVRACLPLLALRLRHVGIEVNGGEGRRAAPRGRRILGAVGTPLPSTSHVGCPTIRDPPGHPRQLHRTGAVQGWGPVAQMYLVETVNAASRL